MFIIKPLDAFIRKFLILLTFIIIFTGIIPSMDLVTHKEFRIDPINKVYIKKYTITIILVSCRFKVLWSFFHSTLTSLRGFLSFFSFGAFLGFFSTFFFFPSSSLSPSSGSLSLAEALLSYLHIQMHRKMGDTFSKQTLSR